MRLLVLGRGKTGSLVAEIARQRGHAVTVLGRPADGENFELTQALTDSCDVVIDFTTPDVVVGNLQTCLASGARVVVGTTGWSQHLPGLSALAREHGASLLYGTNFSIGVQAFFRAGRLLAEALPQARFSIHETHHSTKKDAPSGTALTLQQVVAGATQLSAAAIPIHSTREGDAAGLHVLTIETPEDRLRLEHEACSRRGFAEGAVRAAEWLRTRTEPGVWSFSDVANRLT